MALRRVKLGLMLAEYVKIHKLEIDKADIQKAIMDQAKIFRVEKMRLLILPEST